MNALTAMLPHIMSNSENRKRNLCDILCSLSLFMKYIVRLEYLAETHSL